MLRNRERTEIQKSQRPAERKAPPQRDIVTRKSPKSSNRLIRYFQDTGDELRKVAWPSREQAIRLTLIVLGTTAVTAIFLGSLDSFFRFLSSLLLGTS
jgi:preprotein translocase subunit SecE